MASGIDSLKNLPFKIQGLFLSLIYLSFPYAVFAFRLFPNRDAYNSYAGFYHYVISALLDGHIPYWDPMAACGSPLYLSFLVTNCLDPFFAISILLGKIFALNILQIYYLWIFLSLLPLFLGMYGLIKKMAEHDTVALVGAGFFYITLGLYMFRESLQFVIYWPLLLTVIIHFAQSLEKSKPSWTAFYAAIILFAIALQMYNPAYVLTFLLCPLFWSVVLMPRRVWQLMKEGRQIKMRHWIMGLVLFFILLLPGIIIFLNYQSGEYFAYLRVHQAFGNLGRTVSYFLNESLDYVKVTWWASLTRQGRELAMMITPLFYGLKNFWATGTLYLGFWGTLGILAGIVFRLRGRFVVFLLSGISILFLMTPSAKEFLELAAPILPFLRIMNQRHFLYPAFLIFMMGAAAMGLRILLERSLLKSISQYLRPAYVLMAGILYVAGFIIFTFVSSENLEKATQLFDFDVLCYWVLFLAILTIGAWLARQSLAVPHRPKWYYIFLLAIYCLDAYFYFSLTMFVQLPSRNEGAVAQSRLLRDKLELEYQAYRSPLLPMSDGGSFVSSVVHLSNLRSAFPFYWHGDIFFTTKRYYKLISLLDAAKLKNLLAVDTPMINIYPSSELTQSDALKKLWLMDSKNLNAPVFLQSLEEQMKAADRMMGWPFNGAISTQKFFPVADVSADDFNRAFYTQLFDAHQDIDYSRFVEVSQGIYHKRLYALDLPAEWTQYSSNVDALSRYFFPDFPVATDIDGKITYTDRQHSAFLRVISGKGLMLEEDKGFHDFPRKMYLLNKREVSASGFKISDFGPNHVEIFTDTSTPAVLTYADVFDRHWRATLDGKPVKIFLANAAFKAVQLPAGRHRVKFVYHVPGLDVALILYFAVLIGAIIYYSRLYIPLI